MSELFEWETPAPATKSGPNRRTVAFIEQLRTRPGEWAVYRRDFRSVSVSNYQAHWPGTEWTSRLNADGTKTLYGRWVG